MWAILLILLTSVVALYIRYHFNYWSRRRIPYERPEIPFGSLGDLCRRQRSFGLVMYDIYMRSQEKLVGIYLLFKPAILVRDATLVRQIMITDFSNFQDRGLYVDEEHDPMSANLFSLRGATWKTLRAKLTPSFTSGKLKGMFGVINDVGDKLVQHLNTVIVGQEGKVMEVQTLLRTYAVDVIGSVIFGLDVDSFSNPDNEFRKLSHSLLNPQRIIDKIHGLATFMSPFIATLLSRLGYVDPVLITLRDIIRRTIEMREQQKIIRKDLLQLLIQLRNTGKISEDDDSLWDVETAAEGFKSMSIDMIAAQAFLFYVAGSETTAATVAFTLYELAMYPDLLQKANTDVMDSLEKHSLSPTDKLTYEAVQDMKFLDLCVMETTRKYPGLPFLNRECTEDYQVPGTKYTITKGTPIIISLFGMHRDPEYFPDPMRYQPERYTKEELNYEPIAYMPFGEGPRHCIAQRMGKVNSKVALAKILANFNIGTMERKELEFIFDPAPVLIPKDGLNVKLSRKVLH